MSREAFDLFKRPCRRNLFLRLRRGWGIPWSYIYTDTFGRFVCAAVGHRVDVFYSDNSEGPICPRCIRTVI